MNESRFYVIKSNTVKVYGFLQLDIVSRDKVVHQSKSVFPFSELWFENQKKNLRTVKTKEIGKAF